MKKIILIFLLLAISSCAKKPDDPLIIPPNFNEVPDLNNIDKERNQKQEEDIDVEKLKELLL